jgi:hypothetical protein
MPPAGKCRLVPKKDGNVALSEAPIKDCHVRKYRYDQWCGTEDTWLPPITGMAFLTAFILLFLACAAETGAVSGWAIPMAVSIMCMITTAIIWSQTPIGFFELGRRLRLHNRAVTKLSLLNHLREQCGEGRDIDIDTLVAVKDLLQENHRLLVEAAKLMKEFREKRFMAWGQRISARPWGLENYLKAAKITDIDKAIEQSEAMIDGVAENADITL